MKEKILNYIEANCGPGKYYSSRLPLFDRLRKTHRSSWAGIPVPEFIKTLTELLKQDGIKVEEIS
jgi:hypothetical protein